MSSEPTKTVDEDTEVLHGMGYAQELASNMKGFQNCEASAASFLLEPPGSAPG